MNTITIRLTDDEFYKLEEKRGAKTKANFYREILFEYLRNSEADVSSQEFIKTLMAELDYQKDINRVKDERIKDLQNQSGWLQAEYTKLDLRIDRLLPASSSSKDKKWWEVWKK